MTLTKDDVRHVAKLAALKLNEDEVALRAKELGDVLDYVNKLATVSTRGVVPTCHVHGVVNFFREDIIRDSFSPKEIENIAPDFLNGSFRVPKII